MAPPLLFDISGIDLDHCVHGIDVIERLNPHRWPMRMLDGIIWESTDEGPKRAVAFHDVRDDEFWVRGHIPGRPLFPGVLMIETAAQLASFVFSRQQAEPSFMGFSAVDEVKFRGQVVPGDRFVLLCEEIEMRRRRCICLVQGLVGGRLVFEGKVTGMPI